MFYGYRASQALGHVGLGNYTIVGPYGFDEAWANDDWMKNSWNSDYQPLSYGEVQAAKDTYKALQTAADAGSKQAKAILGQAYIAEIGVYAKSIDMITRAGNYDHDGFQGPTRVNTYNELNTRLQRLAAETVPDVDEEIAAADAKVAAEAAAADAKKAASAAKMKAQSDAYAAVSAKNAADKAAAAAKLEQTQAAADEAKQAAADAAQAKVVAEVSAKKHKEMQIIATQKAATVAGATPYVVGAVAVLTIGAIFLARSGGSAKVAGYRRSRRHR